MTKVELFITTSQGVVGPVRWGAVPNKEVGELRNEVRKVQHMYWVVLGVNAISVALVALFVALLYFRRDVFFFADRHQADEVLRPLTAEEA